MLASDGNGTSAFPLIMSGTFQNEATCNALVKQPAIMTPVGQRLIKISPDVTWSATKKRPLSAGPSAVGLEQEGALVVLMKNVISILCP
jgi:hypothetical protein